MFLEKIKTLKKLNDNVKQDYKMLLQKINPTDIQHQVLIINLSRVIKFFDAYLLLAENGYGEPAATLIRSIYDASVWMRWSLIKTENAQKYLDSGKSEALRIAKRLEGRGIVKIKKIGRQKNAAIESIRSNKFKYWEIMAKEAGLEDWHKLIYGWLSSMSHGNTLAFGDQPINEPISFEPSDKNIKIFFPIAKHLLLDCMLVCLEWILNNQLHPVSSIPNVRK